MNVRDSKVVSGDGGRTGTNTQSLVHLVDDSLLDQGQHFHRYKIRAKTVSTKEGNALVHPEEDPQEFIGIADALAGTFTRTLVKLTPI